MIRVIACLLLSFSPIAVFAETGKIDFNRDVRPVLSENCFHCHGPDSTTRQADLRLDLAESAMTVVDTDDPESSELIRRVLSSDPDEQMPPPGLIEADYTGTKIDSEEMDSKWWII